MWKKRKEKKEKTRGSFESSEENMRTHNERRRRSSDLKHGYHKSLTPSTRKNLNSFYIYCKNTNLHGFRYITINGSTMAERIFWFVTCVMAVMFCVLLMLRLWQNYSRNPIATTIDTSNPIWELSFPAVTICNNNKVYRPHADIIAKHLHLNGFSSNESDQFFSSLMKLIRPDKIPTDNITARQVLDNLNITVETLMLELMQPCSSLLVRCAWIGKIHDCSKIFKTVKSNEGFCCSFNSHYESNINRNSTYFSKPEAKDNVDEFNVTSDDLLNVTDILKVPGNGRDVGLTVALNIEGNMYKATSRPYIGATILISDPIDFPDIGAQTASVAPGHVLAISVAGAFIRSMQSMRSMPPEKRKCFFDDEKPGKRRYSYQSCMTRCIAKYTRHVCGCLPFYLPEKYDGVRTCYLPDLNCLLTIRKTLPNYEACRRCLPQCTDLTYHISAENTKMDDVGYDSDITRGLDVRNTSFLYVYFGDVSYVEYRKESTITWDALLASFGGIFSLCLGGSVLSVMELVYLLARQFLRKRRRERQLEQSLVASSLRPASEIFLSIPVEKIQPRLSRDGRQEAIDGRVFVAWQQPASQRRGTTMKLDGVHRKCGKF